SGGRTRPALNRVSARTSRASSKPVTNQAGALLSKDRGWTGPPVRLRVRPTGGSKGHRSCRSTRSEGKRPRLVVGDSDGAAVPCGSFLALDVPFPTSRCPPTRKRWGGLFPP